MSGVVLAFVTAMHHAQLECRRTGNRSTCRNATAPKPLAVRRTPERLSARRSPRLPRIPAQGRAIPRARGRSDSCEVRRCARLGQAERSRRSPPQLAALVRLARLFHCHGHGGADDRAYRKARHAVGPAPQPCRLIDREANGESFDLTCAVSRLRAGVLFHAVYTTPRYYAVSTSITAYCNHAENAMLNGAKRE